jgi:hypothetical protein
MELPPEFFRSVSPKEGAAILARNGLLTRAQTLRVWRMLGMSGAPPVARARIVLDEDDVREWLRARRVGKH